MTTLLCCNIIQVLSRLRSLVLSSRGSQGSFPGCWSVCPQKEDGQAAEKNVLYHPSTGQAKREGDKLSVRTENSSNGEDDDNSGGLSMKHVRFVSSVKLSCRSHSGHNQHLMDMCASDNFVGTDISAGILMIH